MNFSPDGYRDFIEAFQRAGYRYVGFDRENLAQGDLLLRHDVDADLEASVALARIEQELGVRSTYFLMIRSPLYNLNSEPFIRMAGELLSLGHSVGLHYDQNFDERFLRNNSSNQSALIVSEAYQLSELLGCAVNAVSFHQPSDSLLQSLPDTAPLVSAYGLLDAPGRHYLSDSNRRADFFKKAELRLVAPKASRGVLQVLVHPMWWMYSEEDTAAVWDRVLGSNFHIVQGHLEKYEGAFGPARQLSLG